MNSVEHGRSLGSVGLAGTLREQAVCRELERRLQLLARHRADGRASRLLVRMPSGYFRVFSELEPLVSIDVSTQQGLSALESFDELRIAEAYMNADLDIGGDPLEFFQYRDILGDGNVASYFWTNYLRPKLFGQVSGDVAGIGSHYDEPPEFFELWLDKAFRSYSHGFFEHDGEALEAGMARKLEYAVKACGAKPGDRVLDIGGGWGSFVEYGGTRGLHVTSITISEESERYVARLIAEKDLSHCRVVKQHLLEFDSEPFDAIVNLGVTEHLPNYEATIERYRALLKPGGRLYLDAYSGEKFGMSSFVMKWVFQSNTSPLCLPQYLEALAGTDFEVVLIQNDRHNYYLYVQEVG